MTKAHRNRANSVLVRCTEAMERVLKRVKKYKLPRWRSAEEMDGERYQYEQDMGVSAWEEHRRDLALLEQERVLHYPGEVPK
jgi:hypothetical protein